MDAETVVTETGEVVEVSTFDLSTRRDPKIVLEEARKAADALKDVISKKEKPVIFNKEQYLEFEDWQTVAKFYGVTAKVLSTSPVQFGEVFGFEARAVAIHGPTGREISAADAMCLNDEEKWSSRPKYEYQYVWKSTGKAAPGEPPQAELLWEKGGDGKNRPKKERVLVGQEQVPLFQLRSMAQTRACAKVLRQVLAWVVVLAGYKATPAEEMTGTQDHQKPAEKKQEKAAAESAASSPNKTEGVKGPKDPNAPISEAQKKMLFALIGKSELDEQKFKDHFGIEHMTDLKMGSMNDAIEFIRTYTDREPGDE